MAKTDVAIIGGGLAGLCCAIQLKRAGVPFMLIEADDRLGGRVRTDEVDGFLLDRGFQVLLTAYPECKRMLDYEELNIQPFYPGAMVRHDGAFHRLSDPWRRPMDGIEAVLSGIASLTDKIKVADLRSHCQEGTPEDLLRRPETTTLEALRGYGMSDAIIDRFFRPFLGGVFLDDSLNTSSRMLDFVFRMFSSGNNVLPARGMGAIPEQLASELPAAAIRLNCKVDSIDPNTGTVTLPTGEWIDSKVIVVATEGPEAARLLNRPQPRAWRAVTCVYFAAFEPPIRDPFLVLNGDGKGPVNNMCVPNLISPSYAPIGMSLISATVLGDPPGGDKKLVAGVWRHMQEWFGDSVKQWRPLRAYRIRKALPDQTPGALEPAQKTVKQGKGLIVCGDHMDTASINGAMASGRRAAEAALTELGRGG
ncbi:MAG: FAD-dependent oxidoreductase [Planctomycetes bacterium]|nr:FAD-dependent oxidoreductase [Planctomycetota bacterium]